MTGTSGNLNISGAFGNLNLTGGGSFNINGGGNINVTGSSGLFLPTTGGTSSNLNYYEEFANSNSVSSNAWGGVGGTVNYNIVRVGRSVTLIVPALFATAGGGVGPISLGAGTIPTRFLPSVNGTPIQIFGMSAGGQNNNAQADIVVTIVTDGSIVFYNSAPFGNFTGSGGQTGFYGFTYTWKTG